MRAHCMRVRVWTGIRRIILIHEWNAESLLDEKLLVFIGNYLLLSILTAMGNFYFVLAIKYVIFWLMNHFYQVLFQHFMQLLAAGPIETIGLR